MDFDTMLIMRENFATLALQDPDDTEKIETRLQAFLQVHETSKPNHGYWVHSLSHFDERLWELGLLDWIKRLYGVAFRTALQLGDWNCCDRLLYQFFQRAPWDADPQEYGLSKNTVKMFIKEEMAGRDSPPLRERIELAPFASEEVYQAWKAKYG